MFASYLQILHTITRDELAYSKSCIEQGNKSELYRALAYRASRGQDAAVACDEFGKNLSGFVCFVLTKYIVRIYTDRICLSTILTGVTLSGLAGMC